LLARLLDHLHDGRWMNLADQGDIGHVRLRAMRIEQSQAGHLGLCQGEEGTIQVLGGIALVYAEAHFSDHVQLCRTYPEERIRHVRRWQALPSWSSLRTD
jgi:hypothetical protein